MTHTDQRAILGTCVCNMPRLNLISSPVFKVSLVFSKGKTGGGGGKFYWIDLLLLSI